MTCEQFNKKLFKIVGAKVTSNEIKTFNKHTEACELCRQLLLRTVKGFVDKEMKEKGF